MQQLFVRFEREDCSSCDGTGSRDGDHCRSCRGSGRVMTHQTYRSYLRVEKWAREHLSTPVEELTAGECVVVRNADSDGILCRVQSVRVGSKQCVVTVSTASGKLLEYHREHGYPMRHPWHKEAVEQMVVCLKKRRSVLPGVSVVSVDVPSPFMQSIRAA